MDGVGCGLAVDHPAAAEFGFRLQLASELLRRSLVRATLDRAAATVLILIRDVPRRQLVGPIPRFLEHACHRQPSFRVLRLGRITTSNPRLSKTLSTESKDSPPGRPCMNLQSWPWSMPVALLIA
jgi:hypothetical protein